MRLLAANPCLPRAFERVKMATGFTRRRLEPRIFPEISHLVGWWPYIRYHSTRLYLLWSSQFIQNDVRDVITAISRAYLKNYDCLSNKFMQWRIDFTIYNFWRIF